MRGIMFKPDMIKAIAEGRKTVTRRLRGLEKINQNPDAWLVIGKAIREGVTSFRFAHQATDQIELQIKPRYRIGEVVYIKEAFFESKEIWVEDHYEPDGRIYYKADDAKRYKGLWTSPLFMPEWAAHYFIKITGVRLERLTQITPDDITKEGVDNLVTFILLWDSLNKKRGYEWKTNCWVWVYEFQKV